MRAGRRGCAAGALALRIVAVTAEQEAVDRPPNKQLRDPVFLSAGARARQTVQDVGGEGALHRYMTLPGACLEAGRDSRLVASSPVRLPPVRYDPLAKLTVEQYFVLDPDSVQRLGPSSFRCRIPRMSFFSVWLEPEVDVDVFISDTQVHMRSAGTRVYGSEFVEKSNLNDVFDMFWSTTLTWGPDVDERGVETAAHIAVETEVKVWCEVLSPFHLMPRQLLSGACNAVLRRAVPALLSAFIRNLAADYRKWGNEPVYRAQRAQATGGPLHV